MAGTAISKKGKFGTTMGITSIIAILVILVLIVFSALSITTAQADLRLSEKTAVATADYYEADAAAEKALSEVAIAVTRMEDWEAAAAKAGFTAEKTAEHVWTISGSFTIDANKELQVEATVTPNAEVAVEKVRWQTVPTGSWEADDDLNLVTEF
jgi:hypothetical protein